MVFSHVVHVTMWACSGRGEGKMETSSRLLAVLAALEELGDEELQAVSARALGLLLDRPVDPAIIPLLAVEVVGREESRMLAIYRALAPLAQRRLRTHVWHLYARVRGGLVPAGLISRRAPRAGKRRGDPPAGGEGRGDEPRAPSPRGGQR